MYVKHRHKQLLFSSLVLQKGIFMRVLFEVARIVCICLLLGAVGFLLVDQLYRNFQTALDWLGTIGIFLLIFLLYRNKLQFTGWYRSKKQAAFRKEITLTISILGVVCVLFPIFAGYLH